MEQEFLNIYIETMMATIDDLMRKDIMSRAHIEVAKRVATNLTEENNSLKLKIEELEEKINKKTKKEVSTSSF